MQNKVLYVYYQGTKGLTIHQAELERKKILIKIKVKANIYYSSYWI